MKEYIIAIKLALNSSKKAIKDLLAELISLRGMTILGIIILLWVLTQALQYIILWTISSKVPVLGGWFTHTLLNTIQWGGWIYITFWIILPDSAFDLKKNTGAITENKFVSAGHDDPLAGQRAVYSGFRLKYPFWEEVLATFNLEWQQIDIPAEFTFQTSDGVEAKVGGYQRLQIVDMLRYNLHKPEDVKRIFEGRLTGFLTRWGILSKSNNLPKELIDFMEVFDMEYPPDDDDALERTYGVRTKGIQFVDVKLPKNVELSNEVERTFDRILAAAKKAVEEGTVNGVATISMRDALLFAAATAGTVNPDFNMFALLGSNLGGVKQGQPRKRREDQ